jgi:IS30 family transposase
MPRLHLTRDERIVIATLLIAGHSLRQISRHLGRAASTISREVRRNRSAIMGSYNGGRAHNRAARRRRWDRLRHRCGDESIMDLVREKLKEDLSPDQIAAALPVGRSTIYRFIQAHPEYRRHLRTGRRKWRKRYGKAKRGIGMIANRTMIDERPAIVNCRGRLGDWEGDTYKVKGGWSVALVERKSGFFLSKLVPQRTSEMVNGTINELLGSLPPRLLLTLTLDNGKEFSGHEALADALGIKIYFAHPGAPGERGTCENTIGLMRQYLPKRGRRPRATNKALTRGQNRLNNRPRKRLGYRTPNEVFSPDCCD